MGVQEYYEISNDPELAARLKAEAEELHRGGLSREEHDRRVREAFEKVRTRDAELLERLADS